MSTIRASRVRLYALGSNGNGQLGLNHAEDVDHPGLCQFHDGHDATLTNVPLTDTEIIRKIVAGGNHSVLLTSSGRVWIAGSNGEGQGGISTPSITAEAWQEYRLQDHIACNATNATGLFCTDIAATFSATFLVVSNKQVYCFGTGTKGELGLGPDISCSSVPRLCLDLSRNDDIVTKGEQGRIVSISACMSHVVLVTSTGATYGWGASRKGQLGEIAKGEKTVWKARELDLSAELRFIPRRVVTGRDFTLLLGESKPNYQLLLGDSAKMGFTIPLSFPLDRIIPDAGQSVLPQEHYFRDVQAGWTTIAALTVDHQVHTFGSSRRSLVSIPVHGIRSIATGSEHCVAIDQSGCVIAWGWGEHGNCGPDLDSSKNVKDRVNSIFDPAQGQTVLGIAAGCATTFFWIEQNLDETECTP